MPNTGVIDSAALMLDLFHPLEHDIDFTMGPHAKSSIDVVDGIINESEHF